MIFYSHLPQNLLKVVFPVPKSPIKEIVIPGLIFLANFFASLEFLPQIDNGRSLFFTFHYRKRHYYFFHANTYAEKNY